MKNILREIKLPYLIVGICIIYLAVVMFIFRNPFVSEYELEAGDKLKIKNLLKQDVKASFLTEINEDITKTVGDHDIQVKAKGGTYTVTIHTVDTIKPKVSTKNATIYLNDPVDPKTFVKSIKDQTNVKVTIQNKIDNTKTGKQKVQLLFVDDGGNKVKKEVTANIKKDTEGPKIKTPSSIVVKKGETVAYRKGVTVEDNRDGKIEKYDIDSSKVDLNKIGTYQVIYKAQDSLKNKTEKVVQVRVISYDLEEVKKEADEYADKILSQLVTKKMNDAQKVEKIYYWVRKNYTYTTEHEGTIDDFYKDALTGFKTKRGDCYVVNAMARYLLERTGIETYGVLLHGSDMDHLSFMVDTGDGWYHYCAFRKKSGIVIYKWTDAQMIGHYKKFNVTKLPTNIPTTPKS